MTPTQIPPAPDREEIVRVVQLYVDGFSQGDVEKLKAAFHEDAWIFFTDAKGNLFKDLLTRCFPDWAIPPRPKIVGRFISVIQAGDVASVVLGFDNPTDPQNSWIDFHALLRIDGKWRITNKTATHFSRAQWAGRRG